MLSMGHMKESGPLFVISYCRLIQVCMYVFQEALLAIVEKGRAMYKHGCSDVYKYLGGI